MSSSFSTASQRSIRPATRARPHPLRRRVRRQRGALTARDDVRGQGRRGRGGAGGYAHSELTSRTQVAGVVGVGSQESPLPSRSRSLWSVFGTVGQLSQASPTRSPSVSVCIGLEIPGQLSSPVVI